MNTITAFLALFVGFIAAAIAIGLPLALQLVHEGGQPWP